MVVELNFQMMRFILELQLVLNSASLPTIGARIYQKTHLLSTIRKVTDAGGVELIH